MSKRAALNKASKDATQKRLKPLIPTPVVEAVAGKAAWEPPVLEEDDFAHEEEEDDEEVSANVPFLWNLLSKKRGNLAEISSPLFDFFNKKNKSLKSLKSLRVGNICRFMQIILDTADFTIS